MKNRNSETDTMSRIFPTTFIALCCGLLPLSINIAAAQTPENLPVLEERAFKQAAAVVSPSIVRIETVGGRERVGNMLVSSGPTTGVIVSPDGEIITSSFNFVAEPTSILVTLADNRRFPAKQIASDHVKMLTLIKIEASELPPIPAAPYNEIRVGQWAMALGRTYQTPAPSVSIGIVSALNRIWGKAIQTDAKVSPVNYGGPLVDVQGRALGVLVPLSPQGKSETAGVEWYDAGIGFAIPMEEVYGVLDQLRKGEDLLTGLLGLSFQGKDIYGTPPVIDRVWYNSPAQKAGLESNDKIIEVNGEAVERVAQVRHALGSSYAGEKIALVVSRGDETLKTELTLTGTLEPYELPFLGILAERRPESAEPPAQLGVPIRFVFSDSPAAQAGLLKGDIITNFADAAVESAESLGDAVSRLRPEEQTQLIYSRDGMSQTVELTLTSIPNDIPAELPVSIIHPPAKAENADNEEEDTPKTGRIAETMESHNRDWWAFVPDDYNPDYQYGLVVWIHPNGSTMEAELLKAWKPACRERGLILLAPKAGQREQWTPNDLEFIKELVEEFQKRYSIDHQRITLHGYDSGAVIAQALAFKERELFRGLSIVGGALSVRPQENRPDLKLQWQFVCGAEDPLVEKVDASVKVLRERKFPVNELRPAKLGHDYPSAETVSDIARWIDLLDRI